MTDARWLHACVCLCTLLPPVSSCGRRAGGGAAAGWRLPGVLLMHLQDTCCCTLRVADACACGPAPALAPLPCFTRYAATKMFVSNLNARLAQRFLALVLLPRVRRDIAEHKRLHFALFQALKKATYKPGAFYKVCVGSYQGCKHMAPRDLG